MQGSAVVASDLSFLTILPLPAHCSSSLLALLYQRDTRDAAGQCRHCSVGLWWCWVSHMSWVGSSLWDWGLKGWKHPCCHETPLPCWGGTFSKPQVTESCSHLCPTVW